MNSENGHKPQLGFDDLVKILTDKNIQQQRIVIMWSFLGSLYTSSRFSFWSDDSGFRIFVNYTNSSKNEGTFVLDKDTLATDFVCLINPQHT